MADYDEEELSYQRRLDEVAAMIVENVIAGVNDESQQPFPSSSSSSKKQQYHFEEDEEDQEDDPDVLDDLDADVADGQDADVRLPHYTSESNASYVPHALPHKGDEVLQPWSLPIPLDATQMNAGKWKSESQAAFTPDASEGKTNKTAGNKSVRDVKAPVFFAWSLDATASRPSTAAVEEAPIPGLPTPFLGHSASFGTTGPIGLNAANADQWVSEYASSSAAAISNPTPTVVAGTRSPAREKVPAFYVWPVPDQHAVKKAIPLVTGTEHSDRYSWPIDETSPTLVPVPPTLIRPKSANVSGSYQSAPYGVYANAVTESAWLSEYDSRFHSNVNVNANTHVNTHTHTIETVTGTFDVDEAYAQSEAQLPPPPTTAAASSSSNNNNNNNTRLPPPPPAAQASKQKPKKLRFITEHQSSFTWPSGKASATANSAAMDAALATAAAAAAEQEAQFAAIPTSTARAAYRWPQPVYTPTTKRSSNESDPCMLFHAPALPGTVDMGPASPDAADPTLEDALFSIDSLAATAQATAADTISTTTRQGMAMQADADAEGEVASVPASSVTGPTSRMSRRRTASTTSHSHSHGQSAAKLAVIGRALLPLSGASNANIPFNTHTTYAIAASKCAVTRPVSGKARVGVSGGGIGAGAGVGVGRRGAALAAVMGRQRKAGNSNPVLRNARYPGASDKQNGRWTTEARAAFAYRPPSSSSSIPASKK